MDKGAVPRSKLSVMSSKTVLRLNELPNSVREALSAYDNDGDGVIDISELISAGNKAKSDAKNVSRLAKLALALFLLCVCNLAAIFGLVYSVVALTKDSKVDANNQLVTRAGTPVTTGPALSVLPVGSTTLPTAFAYVAFTTAAGYNYSLPVDGAVMPNAMRKLSPMLTDSPIHSAGYVAIPNQAGAAVLFTPAGNVLYYQGTVTPYDTTLDALAASVVTPAAAYLSQQLSAGRRLLGRSVGGGAQACAYNPSLHT